MKKILIVCALLIAIFWNACSSSTEPEEVILVPNKLAIGSSNQIFITTNAGLYQSLDDGKTWESIDPYFGGLIAVSPSGIIYCTKYKKIGTYRSNEYLYRSTDGGKTFFPTGWVRYDVFIGMAWIAFNKQDHLFAAEWMEGIFRSTSQGEKWEKLSGGSGVPLIAPSNLFGTQSDGVYRSEDNGNSWTKVLELHDASGDTTFYYGPLTFNSQERIFASIVGYYQSDSVEIGMVYHSDDNGNNWNKSVATNSRIAHLAVNSEGKIFALTERNEIYCSVDNGNQWNRVSVNSFEGWVMQFIISSNNKLFITTADSKLYLSEDEGISWEQIQLHL